jgi:hypothetical protein
MATRAELEAAKGRPVYGADGVFLGKVTDCRDDGFYADRGPPFRKTLVIRLEDVAAIEPGRVNVRRPSTDYLGPRWGSREFFHPHGEKP